MMGAIPWALSLAAGARTLKNSGQFDEHEGVRNGFIVAAEGYARAAGDLSAFNQLLESVHAVGETLGLEHVNALLDTFR